MSKQELGKNVRDGGKAVAYFVPGTALDKAFHRGTPVRNQLACRLLSGLLFDVLFCGKGTS
jgi:hypothetical protein